MAWLLPPIGYLAPIRLPQLAGNLGSQFAGSRPWPKPDVTQIGGLPADRLANPGLGSSSKAQLTLHKKLLGPKSSISPRVLFRGLVRFLMNSEEKSQLLFLSRFYSDD